MAPLVELLSWTSVDALRRKIRNIGTKTLEPAGQWHSRDLEVAAPRTLTGKATYRLRYRRVADVIRFFLGYAGFKETLVFEPYRLRTPDKPPRRVYSNIASADW